MTSSGSREWIRTTSSLDWGFPGTKAIAPDLAAWMAESRTSRCKLPFRARSSGPWHLKQCWERMGRTAVLKSGPFVVAAVNVRQRLSA